MPYLIPMTRTTKTTKATCSNRGRGMARRNRDRGENLRLQIAQEAARIIAEQGIEDYLQAKRKAAERFGACDKAVLPKNAEIEAAEFKIH